MSNLRVSKKIENLFIQYIILYQIITSIMNTTMDYQIGDEVTWSVQDITGTFNRRYGTIIKINKKTYGIQDTTPGWPEQSFNISKKIPVLMYGPEPDEEKDCECGGDYETCPDCGDPYKCSYCGLCDCSNTIL